MMGNSGSEPSNPEDITQVAPNETVGALVQVAKAISNNINSIIETVINMYLVLIRYPPNFLLLFWHTLVYVVTMIP